MQIWRYTIFNLPAGHHHVNETVIDSSTHKVLVRNKKLLAFTVAPKVGVSFFNSIDNEILTIAAVVLLLIVGATINLKGRAREER
jgi:hypothetical protein